MDTGRPTRNPSYRGYRGRRNVGCNIRAGSSPQKRKGTVAGREELATEEQRRTAIRVLVVSGINLYREGLAHVLGADGRIEVVGTCERVGEAVEALQELSPDVVLLDMAARDARAMAREVADAKQGVRIVALGLAEQDVVRYAEVGICGYVVREGSVDDLVDAVEAAMHEELHCSSKVAAALLRQVGRLAAERRPGERARLTPRELEVVALIDRGLTNKEIASRLVIEVATVKNHVHNLLEKLGAQTRSEAAARVRRMRRAPFANL